MRKVVKTLVTSDRYDVSHPKQLVCKCLAQQYKYSTVFDPMKITQFLQGTPQGFTEHFPLQGIAQWSVIVLDWQS